MRNFCVLICTKFVDIVSNMKDIAYLISKMYKDLANTSDPVEQVSLLKGISKLSAIENGEVTSETVDPGPATPPSTYYRQSDLTVADVNAMTDIIIHDFEGTKITKDKSDPGGITLFGLTARDHPNIADKIVSAKLTLEEAKDVFREEYFDKIYGGYQLPRLIAFIAYDARIHGSFESIVDLQNWLRTKGHNITNEGKFGPSTYSAVMSISPDQYRDLVNYLLDHAASSAAKAAKRVRDYQDKHGLPPYDYTNGFTNRLVKRYTQAERVQFA